MVASEDRMSEVFLVIVYLAVFVAVIAVIGHGIWVLVAWVFRGLGRLFSGKAAARERPIAAEVCPLCSWSARGFEPGPTAGAERVLELLRRRIERQHELGLISTEIRNRLIQA